MDQKHILIILVVFLFLGSQARSSESYTDLPLSHCISNGKKDYFGDHSDTKFPKKVSYKCTYVCNTGNELKKVEILHNASVATMYQEAIYTTCHGVTLKESPWGFELDQVNSFYGYTIAKKDFRKWCSENLDRNPEEEQRRLTNLKSQLQSLISNYKYSAEKTSIEYKEQFLFTIEKLQEIDRELPAKTSALDYFLNLDLKSASPYEAFVHTNLLGIAMWRFDRLPERLSQ